ncbi:hypothetical protein HYH03_000198 [Edaphochlamys debaryana]|uniref:Protein kinase domain-containing protein n=1 Tax=Edaphochlamys debaryana TaxID=47281 RepID=A0A835YIS1_9CHLO|nr:hypothetical protein HYH03_000198 [Edaphochlamys debaryana]|eukprot:KAG2501696.1 hypothetical protein HYH03_000198 [Edaphochlamys debaryana]
MKERYAVLGPLGSGAYGQVYKCLDKNTNEVVALKVVNVAHLEPLVMRLAMRELRTLQRLPPHPHVVELRDAFKSSGSGRVFLVFSCEGRSLHEEAEQYPDYVLPGPMLKQLAWQLLQALHHLHEQRVIHRDVKPGNILVAGDGAGGQMDLAPNGANVFVRLADFGFARSWTPGEGLSSYVATRWFRAPEILVRSRYGYNSDCWSVGCTVAELASGQPLFPGTSTLDQVARIMRCFGPMPRALASAALRDERLCGHVAMAQRSAPSRTLRQRLPNLDTRLFEFISACLTVDPSLRPSARELMQMPYFWDVVPHAPALPCVAAAAKRKAAAAVAAAAAGAGVVDVVATAVDVSTACSGERHTPAPQTPEALTAPLAAGARQESSVESSRLDSTAAETMGADAAAAAAASLATAQSAGTLVAGAGSGHTIAAAAAAADAKAGLSGDDNPNTPVGSDSRRMRANVSSVQFEVPDLAAPGHERSGTEAVGSVTAAVLMESMMLSRGDEAELLTTGGAAAAAAALAGEEPVVTESAVIVSLAVAAAELEAAASTAAAAGAQAHGQAQAGCAAPARAPAVFVQDLFAHAVPAAAGVSLAPPSGSLASGTADVQGAVELFQGAPADGSAAALLSPSPAALAAAALPLVPVEVARGPAAEGTNTSTAPMVVSVGSWGTNARPRPLPGGVAATAAAILLGKAGVSHVLSSLSPVAPSAAEDTGTTQASAVPAGLMDMQSEPQPAPGPGAPSSWSALAGALAAASTEPVAVAPSPTGGAQARAPTSINVFATSAAPPIDTPTPTTAAGAELESDARFGRAVRFASCSTGFGACMSPASFWGPPSINGAPRPSYAMLPNTPPGLMSPPIAMSPADMTGRNLPYAMTPVGAPPPGGFLRGEKLPHCRGPPVPLPPPGSLSGSYGSGVLDLARSVLGPEGRAAANRPPSLGNGASAEGLLFTWLWKLRAGRNRASMDTPGAGQLPTAGMVGQASGGPGAGPGSLPGGTRARAQSVAQAHLSDHGSLAAGAYGASAMATPPRGSMNLQGAPRRSWRVLPHRAASDVMRQNTMGASPRMECPSPYVEGPDGAAALASAQSGGSSRPLVIPRVVGRASAAAAAAVAAAAARRTVEGASASGAPMGRALSRGYPSHRSISTSLEPVAAAVAVVAPPGSEQLPTASTPPSWGPSSLPRHSLAGADKGSGLFRCTTLELSGGTTTGPRALDQGGREASAEAALPAGAPFPAAPGTTDLWNAMLVGGPGLGLGQARSGRFLYPVSGAARSGAIPEGDDEALATGGALHPPAPPSPSSTRTRTDLCTRRSWGMGTDAGDTATGACGPGEEPCAACAAAAAKGGDEGAEQGLGDEDGEEEAPLPGGFIERLLRLCACGGGQ